MPYSQFTLDQAKRALQLNLVEGTRFFPQVDPVDPSPRLLSEMQDIPWALAVGSEKARSESIIYPILQEVRRQSEGKVSLFSGKEFNVDAALNLVGYVDFLLSRSPEQLIIEAPVAVIVEAKKADLNEGLGQCVATMAAAWRFNEAQQNPISTVYGTVSSGTTWRFLKLEGTTVTIDLTDYPVPPVEPVLSLLMWMVGALESKNSPD